MKLKSLSLAVAAVIVTTISSQASASCSSQLPQAKSTVNAYPNGSFHYFIEASSGTGCGSSGSNTSGYMSDFYVPYFDDMGIQNLSVRQVSGPAGLSWASRIEATNDIFHLGGGALHFYATSTPQSLSYNTIFIDFNAAFGEVKGPFDMTMNDLYTGAAHDYLGDPGIPGSPKTIAALDAPQGQGGTVPEPATLSLFALGTAALLARRRKKA